MPLHVLTNQFRIRRAEKRGGDFGILGGKLEGKLSDRSFLPAAEFSRRLEYDSRMRVSGMPLRCSVVSQKPTGKRRRVEVVGNVFRFRKRKPFH